MIKACKIFHKHMRARIAQRLTVSVCVCIRPAAHMYRVCEYAVCVWVTYRKKTGQHGKEREMSGGQESGEWKAEKKMN